MGVVERKKMKTIRWLAISILLFNLTACDAVAYLISTPPPTATTAPLPSPTVKPSDTPIPSPTFTLAPTDTLPPPPTEAPPTPALPTATLTKDQAVLVYYINKDEKGPFGCGEALWYVKTSFPKTGNIPVDVSNALRTILSYHSETIGIMRNPGYASNLAVSEVKLNGGAVQVYLTGEYIKTKDACDPSRFKDQLRFTIKQFPGITGIQIYINGFPIADVLSRK
jgi:hypothetical protein